MTVAGRFFAIITNTTFTKLDSKLNFTYMTFPKKKAAQIITTSPIPISLIH
jgi:hypothetical protein